MLNWREDDDRKNRMAHISLHYNKKLLEAQYVLNTSWEGNVGAFKKDGEDGAIYDVKVS